ncbi:hypothetical protein pb186bvf_015408 [Paramecium bursaria]
MQNSSQNVLDLLSPLKQKDPKFSVEAEYYDPINAEVACEQLSGYKFQNRDLKVRLSGNPQPSRIRMIILNCLKILIRLKKQTIRHQILMIFNQQYDCLIWQITEQSIDTRKSFYENLTNSQKIAILEEIKLVYGNKPQLLAELLKQNQKMAKLILTIQQDVMSRQEERRR